MSALEFRQVTIPIARAFGSAGPPAAFRLAPDEWLLLGDDASAALAVGGSDVVDFSSGFVCLELSGERWEDAFRHLSDLELPEVRPALVQGHVAEVDCKAVVGPELLLLVPPIYAHHVRDVLLGLAEVGFQTREVSPERIVA